MISSRALPVCGVDIQAVQVLAPLSLGIVPIWVAAFSAVNSKQLQIKLRENMIKLSLVFLSSENLTLYITSSAENVCFDKYLDISLVSIA